ncbi:MAG: NAD(P)/FAD-dependent oxidoreductase [Chlamydiota bacterium]|nr:NAD(P)/FAD-dependent oxidoreductase [Chlamydiota bacterium]
MLEERYDIVIIGAGPAGLIAAIECHEPGRSILVVEKMHTPAMKLKISGKGRCNITNAAEREDFIKHFGKNGRFLKFAFSEFFNTDLIRYFEDLGVRFKLERGGRYFPEGDDAMDVVNALLRKIHALRISLVTHLELIDIAKSDDETFRIILHKKSNALGKSPEPVEIHAQRLLLATGGKSYPKTGSTGSGQIIAARLGHTVTPLTPSLVPLETKGETAGMLEGLSLRNVEVSIWSDCKKISEDFGEMVFTDFGLSGPVILTLSRTVIKLMKEKKAVSLKIDLKPALERDILDKRLLREISGHPKQCFKNVLKELLPKRLALLFAQLSQIPEAKPLNQITAEERKQLITLLKDFSFDIAGYRSFDHAIVTSGGIYIQEINPQTMSSKLIKGLYFAGEMIDVDADTGGYNLQAAFSTGWVAGRAIKASLK